MKQEPLQPRSYCSEAPPTPSPQIPDVDPVAVAARVAIDGEIMALKLNARMDRAEAARIHYEDQRTIDALRKERDEERQQHGEEYKRLQSIIEDLRTRLVAKFYFRGLDVEEAKARKQKLLADVKAGRFIPNANKPTRPTVPATTENPIPESESCQKNPKTN
jgi:hypothetical protein